MPVYKYEIEVGRKLTDAEKQELHDVVARAWAGMQRASDRQAALATTIHARHLDRVADINALHPEGHKRAGQPVYSANERIPHLFCSDCGRELVGYGRDGGLACPSVAQHPDAKGCHGSCVVECGESPIQKGLI